MFAWLKPAPFAAPLPAAQVDASYRRLRRQVFIGIFTGYAGYYLVRNNLALAIALSSFFPSSAGTKSSERITAAACA